VNRRQLLKLSSAALAPAALPGAAETYDVCIYGATPGGIGAAVAAARMGRRVALVDYEDHIGGIVSNGLTNADIMKRQAVGGLYYEFTRRVVKHYEAMDRNDPAQPNVKLCRDGYYYEASLAEKLFHEMIAEQGSRIRLLLQHELEGVDVRSGRLRGARFSKGLTVEAAVFVDATYEGDLAAMAGVPFRTGREGRAEFNEPHAGRIYMRFHTPEILEGSTGEGDNATQAFCYRFHVTDLPENRVPIEKPAGYRREDYRHLLEDIKEGRVKTFRQCVLVLPMPLGKYEVFNLYGNGPNHDFPTESMDLAEENWAWPTASLVERRKIQQRYLSHNVGLLWFLQNDPEIRVELRNEASRYGWCKDEWRGNGHVPRQVYVRQGRRIQGEYTLTERDGDVVPQIGRAKVQPTSIGIVEWPYDPHAHHKYDGKHRGVREGYFMVPHEPFQIPYGVVVPQKIDGLLVPVACSCSHVAYNALRMEPVFMILGEACGIAAHLAIQGRRHVRNVPVPVLQRLLVERRGVITFFEDLKFDDPHHAAMQWLGARGFNQGYRANVDAPLTAAEAAAMLERVTKAMGKAPRVPSIRSSVRTGDFAQRIYRVLAAR
jgi:hypothetical protein